MRVKRIRSTCKAMSDNDTQGKAIRLGETMGEAAVSTHAPHRGPITTMPDDPFPPATEAKVRIFEDGSGTFEFHRGAENITIRWTEEDREDFQLFADFNGIGALLMPDNTVTPETEKSA